jgi:hypothetical protein
MEQLKAVMRPGLPLLDRVGMFDLFPAEDWIRGTNPARTVVGELYNEYKAQKDQA